MSAHGKPGHGAKCSCEECRTERRLYKRSYRAAKRGLAPLPAQPETVGTVEAAEARADGSVATFEGAVTRGVRAEIAMCAGAGSHPGLVETALTLARGLDDPRQITTWPSLARQLMVALDKIHAASASNGGRLVAVGNLSSRKKPTS